MTIVSVASDYNGDSYSDAALYSRGTSQLHRHADQRIAAGHRPQQFDGAVTGVTVTGTGIPSGTTIESVTATTITLSANATASGAQSLTADPGCGSFKYLVGPANPAPFWFTSGTAFGPANVIPFQGDFDGDG